MSGHTHSKKYRHLYKTARWVKHIRPAVLNRDGYTCQICGVLCVESVNRPRSPIVDHKKNHKGDLDLFYDMNNLQTLCKSCHDQVKRTRDLRGYRDEVDATGWPVDPRHPANRKP